MSTLILDELYPGVVFEQTIRISKDTSVAHIRPWVYRQGTLVDGVFTCRIKNGSTLLKEVTIDYTEINAATSEDYSHGFMRFDTENLPLLVPDEAEYQDYIIEFEMVGHTLSGVNFVGICRSWDNKVYDTITPAANDMIEPAGIEIYEFKEKL